MMTSFSKNHNKLSINNITAYDKITIGVIVVVIAMVLSLIVTGINENERDNVQQVKKQMERMSQSYETQLDRYVMNKISLLQYMQTFPDIYNMDWNTQKKFLQDRSKQLGFHHIFIMDNRGYGYYLEDNVIKNQSNEPFYKDVFSKEVLITEPFSDPEKMLTIITMCVAIHNNGQRVGAICGTIDINELKGIIAGNEVIAKGNFALLNRASTYNRQGEYLAGTDVEEQDIYDKVSIFDKEEKDRIHNKLDIIHTTMESGKNIFGSITIEGEEYYAYVTCLEEYDWIVVQYIKKSTVLAATEHKYFLLIALMVIIILLTVIAFTIISDFLKDNKRLCTDAMTGCNNRLACDTYLNKLENHYWESISIVFFDLNNFKYANDVFGHDNGDRLLKILAEALEKTFGADGTVFRLGGDEFVSVGIDRTENAINESWEELQRLLAEESSKLDFNYQISASYGYAIRHNGSYENLHTLMERADRAMYDYKESWKKEHHSYR